jgi:hypothetical protein
MADWSRDLKDLAWGPLLESLGSDSVCFRAVLCDLSPRFIPKCRVGRGYRAVARNGRVLLASNMPLESLRDREAEIRLQTWRKVILPGDTPEVYGVLMCARRVVPGCRSWLEQQAGKMILQSQLVKSCRSSIDLAVNVGGGTILVFLPARAQV